jgi:flagellar assembly protein FliH
MSSRARRLPAGAPVQPFGWGDASPAYPSGPAPERRVQEPDCAQVEARLAALEREAFAKGYEQGERAGLEAGGMRADAMLRRLAQTLDQVGDLRRTMIRETEAQMVELALAIARRIVRREVALDQHLTLSMARLALERLGERTSATVRLHPDDLAATAAGRSEWSGSHVTVVADASVSRGGCRIESDFGSVDASVDAQFREVARALLVEEGTDIPMAVDCER